MIVTKIRRMHFCIAREFLYIVPFYTTSNVSLAFLLDQIDVAMSSPNLKPICNRFVMVIVYRLLDEY